MRPNDQVTFVRYGFFALALFESYDELDHCDVPASARKYAELCEQRLQAEYPRARVEVVVVEDDDVEGALPDPMRTQVLVDPGSEIVLPPDEFELFSTAKVELEDSERGEGVDQICKEIFENYEWLVRRPWLGLEEAGQRFQIPIPALRWLCSNGFISEAKGVSSGWEFPQESLVDFRREHKGLFDSGSILSVVGLESAAVSKSYPSEVLFAADWPAPDEVWIAPAVQLDGLPFQAGDWSLLVDRQGITLEHHWATYWEKEVAWTYSHYARAMVSEARNYGIEALVGDSQMTFKSVRSSGSPLTPHQSAQHLANELNLVQQNATIVLSGGLKWKPEYEKDEGLFCREILEPLLRRMGYRDVQYTHGQDECGRDFVFSEETRFGDLQYYAVQAKAGNVRGGVNSIEGIFGQLDDAFKMEYIERGRAPVHIAICIVAISGHFTKNAKEKIRQKMPTRVPVGAVYFWDKAKILSLIQQYWG